MKLEQDSRKQDVDVAVPGSRALSEAELDVVNAGGGVLVHEPVHSGTVKVPSTGGVGTGQTPRLPATSARSPPSGAG